jgi:hypothetical protein
MQCPTKQHSIRIASLDGNSAFFSPLINIFVSLGSWLADKSEDKKRGRSPQGKEGCLTKFIFIAIICGIVICFAVTNRNSSHDSLLSNTLLMVGAVFLVVAIAQLMSDYEWRKKTGLGCFLPVAVILLICGIAFRSSGSSYRSDSNYKPSIRYSDYETNSITYQDRIEQKVRRSTRDLKANVAQIYALAERMDSQNAVLASASSVEEKNRAIDALMATLEGALEITRESISILEENRKDGYANLGYISEAELSEILSSCKTAERAALSRISELKKQRADLEREMTAHQTPDEEP